VPPAGQHADEAEPGADVPGTAAGLAEISARDAGEAVLARLEQHSLEQDSGGLLLLGAPGDRGAGGLQPLGQLIADLLELAEIEQPDL
jgi:hypothetical protein